MDIVVPYKHSESQELKYALRSIVKHLKGWNKIFIVGDAPFKLKTDERLIHIPFEDVPGRKNYSMYLKVLRACEENISEHFLYWHDDHFLLKDLEASDLPAYYDCTLSQQAAKLGMGRYYQETVNTIHALGSGDFYHYDIHVPCQMIRSEVLSLKWDEDMIFKSWYINSFGGKNPQFMSDLKLDHPKHTYSDITGAITHRIFFSTGDHCGKAMRRVWEQLYPEPTVWEPERIDYLVYSKYPVIPKERTCKSEQQKREHLRSIERNRLLTT